MTHTVTAIKGSSITDHNARSLDQARKMAEALIDAGLAESAVIHRGMQPIERIER